MGKETDHARLRVAVWVCVVLVYAGALLSLLQGGTRRRGRGRHVPAPGEVEAAAAAGALARCTHGMVTVKPCGGRLGNKFMEVASAWAVARASGLRLVTPARLRKAMARAFRRAPLGKPLAVVLRSCTAAPAAATDRQLEYAAVDSDRLVNASAVYNVVLSAREHNLTDPLIVLKSCSVLVKFLVPLSQELSLEFQFHEYLRERAQAVLRDLRAKTAARRLPGDRQWTRGGPIFVSVHARRTDYFKAAFARHRSQAFAEVDYFVEAMSRLRRDIQANGSVATPLVLVAVSDDMDWVRRKLLPALRRLDSDAGAVDAFAAGGGTSMQDLALLAACNHSVISYGTYGMTGALLAGGRVVAYNVSSKYWTSEFAQLDAKWTVLR